MFLFLQLDLQKSGNASKAPKSKRDTKGEQRGGKYVARVQIGYEKDNSPKYRYFKTNEEFEAFLENRGRSEKTEQSQKLEQKVKQEHRESKARTTGTVVHTPASRESLLVKEGKKQEKEEAKDDDDKKVKKSLVLFVWSDK